MALLATVLAFAGWFLWLRPTTLGGEQSYVIVVGSSMEPTYHDGDLVIVREEDHYGKGDIIAFHAGGHYEDPTRIIHRIVDDAGDGAFITQGDNRDRTDPWQPTPDTIIGRAVVHVPHAGDLAAAAGRPQVLGALGALAVMLGRQRRRRRRMTALPGSQPPRPRPPLLQRTPGTGVPRWLRHTTPRWAFVGFVVGAVVAVPVLASAWTASRASDTVVRTDVLGEANLGISYDYAFLGAPSTVYPEGRVGTTRDDTGLLVPADPLYARLLDRLELTLGFRSTVSGADEAISNLAADVTVSMPEGWSGAVTSIGPTPFDGQANHTLSIDLQDLAARVGEVGALTGVGGSRFTVEVEPRLTVDGDAGGEGVEEELATTLSFVVSDGVIEALPLEEAELSRPITRAARTDAEYGLGPLSVKMSTARGLLSGLALVVLGIVGWCASVLFGGVGLREADRIAARYRSQLVDVSAATGPPGPVVLVGGIEELARLAKVEQSVILHEDLGDGAHRYRVFLGAVTYEYESAPEHGGRAAVPMPGDMAEREPGG